MSKIAWSGTIISVQPRIRLWRSFDQRAHNYLGYSLVVDGDIDNERCQFSVGLGKAVYQKHQFQVGDAISGESLPVADPHLETVDYYQTSKLKVIHRAATPGESGPPWHGIAPELEVYRERGHRRLAAQTYDSKCLSCIWACRMAVEMVIDQWRPHYKKYRDETFCYGPKSCKFYKAGPPRKVPGRRGMTWEEADWVDEDATAHRGVDE